MFKPFAAAMVATSLLAGAATAQDGTLEPEAIEALFPGHYEAIVTGGYRLLIAAKEDGSLMGRAFGREDKGAWKMVDNELCVAWRSWTSGKFKCGSILQNGEWYVATDKTGDKTMRFRAIDKRVVMAAEVGRRAVRD